jgi:hypothetical protein
VIFQIAPWSSFQDLVSLVFSKSALSLTTSYPFSCVGSTSFRSLLLCSTNNNWLLAFAAPLFFCLNLQTGLDSHSFSLLATNPWPLISFLLWLRLRTPNFPWLSIQSRLSLYSISLVFPFPIVSSRPFPLNLGTWRHDICFYINHDIQLTISYVSLILQNTQHSTDRFARSIRESVCIGCRSLRSKIVKK